MRALIPAAVVAAFAILMLLLQGAWRARDVARLEAAAAQASATSAKTQGEFAEAAAMTVQATQTRELTLTVQAKEAAYDIARSDGGQAQVPEAALAGWADAIDRLRLDAGAPPGALDGSTGRNPASPVSAPAQAGVAKRG